MSNLHPSVTTTLLWAEGAGLHPDAWQEVINNSISDGFIPGVTVADWQVKFGKEPVRLYEWLREPQQSLLPPKNVA